jgi:hypothetical protein
VGPSGKPQNDAAPQKENFQNVRGFDGDFCKAKSTFSAMLLLSRGTMLPLLLKVLHLVRWYGFHAEIEREGIDW